MSYATLRLPQQRGGERGDESLIHLGASLALCVSRDKNPAGTTILKRAKYHHSPSEHEKCFAHLRPTCFREENHPLPCFLLRPSMARASPTALYPYSAVHERQPMCSHNSCAPFNLPYRSYADMSNGVNLIFVFAAPLKPSSPLPSPRLATQLGYKPEAGSHFHILSSLKDNKRASRN